MKKPTELNITISVGFYLEMMSFIMAGFFLDRNFPGAIAFFCSGIVIAYFVGLWIKESGRLQ